MGSHVADALIRNRHQVTVLDDLSGGFRENVPNGALFVEGSVVDAVLLNRLFADARFEHVFHLAAYAAEGLSHFIKRFNYTNNVIGSVNLINASVNSGVKSFVFTSSIAVYGSSPQLPMREETAANPQDSYGIAKLAVEQELKATQDMFGMDYTIFRPHNVFGPRQNIGDRYRNVVGIFMNQILQGKSMTIFGDGNQTRAFTCIDDVAPLIAQAIDVPAARNEVFNIGADAPCSLNDLARLVAAAMGVEPRVVHLESRHEVVHAYSAHDKLHKVFPVQSATTLEAGLRTMASWVKQHGPRRSRQFQDIEITRNLPEVWREA
jgi:UDP-glucose 4-epimerase